MLLTAALKLRAPGVQPVERLAALAAARVRDLLLKLGAARLRLLKLLFKGLDVPDRAAHVVEPALGVVHLCLKLRQHALAVIAPLALPCAQPLVSFAE